MKHYDQSERCLQVVQVQRARSCGRVDDVGIAIVNGSIDLLRGLGQFTALISYRKRHHKHDHAEGRDENS